MVHDFGDEFVLELVHGELGPFRQNVEVTLRVRKMRPGVERLLTFAIRIILVVDVVAAVATAEIDLCAPAVRHGGGGGGGVMLKGLDGAT